MVQVAYRRNVAVISDMIGGQIPIMIADFNTGMPQLKAGKVKALAVLTRERHPALPEVPTLHETVMPGYHILAWAGMFGPAGMPDEAVQALASAVDKALQRPEVRGRFANSGTDIYWSGPKEFDAFVKSELISWTAMIKEAGIEPE
jgi:tripartite-type tricarboxylate transporter receptor subunit TctC